MFDASSRYAGLAIKTLRVTFAGGETREIRHVERRFVPPAGTGATMVEHVVAQGDRLDNITAAYLGDPAQFWRVCDANEAMDPRELTAEVNGRIRIAMPGL